MTRYLRLYAYFVRFSFSRALEFRLDFFFRVWMDAIWYAVNLAFFSVLFEHTGTLGGWTFDQAIVFAAGLFFVDAMHMTLFSNNTWWFPQLVNKGDLDYYLVRPVSSLFFVSLREFAANSFLNLLMATGILLWALLRFPGDLGFERGAVYVGCLLVGVVLHYCLHMLFVVPVFWTHSVGGLQEIFYAMDRYTSRPHRVYRGWVFRILVTVLPFALVVSFPAEILWEGLRPSLLLHLLGVTAAAFVVLVLLWRRGLRAYVSASS